jgi:endogenous inhibitor of DNA gyrase (YacG/DUF329 family)
MNPCVEKPFGRQNEMTTTLIVKCPECGGLMMATKGQKTKLCPYCGKRVDMLRAQRVASASNAFKASEMLKKLKSEQGFEKLDY